MLVEEVEDKGRMRKLYIMMVSTLIQDLSMLQCLLLVV